jgi:hypothetical protein
VDGRPGEELTTFIRVHRMAHRDEGDFRPHHHALLQPDAGVVEEGAVLVDEDPLRQLEP